MLHPPERPANEEETFSSPVMLVVEHERGGACGEGAGRGVSGGTVRGMAALFLPEVGD